jgi:quinol monooxygenase YgiN
MKMRTKLALLAATVGLTSINVNGHANEALNMNNHHKLKEATMIKMESQHNKSAELEKFLKLGGSLVKKTEPNTKVWFALKESNKEFIIFDAFLNDEGRNQHFAGKVAAALKEDSKVLVKGGWEDGVVKHITNSRILSSKMPSTNTKVTVANYIVFKAKEGRTQQLADLLTGAAELVQKTEPKTTFWFALKLNDDTFAIFDAFEDASGQKAHFAGKVAGALKSNSKTLVKDGWEKGVVANIKEFKVIVNI